MYLQAKPTKLATGANNAARTVTNTKKFDHVTPVLREFQWSSVKESAGSTGCHTFVQDMSLWPCACFRKGRMHIVTAQGIKISCNLPFVELLPKKKLYRIIFSLVF